MPVIQRIALHGNIQNPIDYISQGNKTEKEILLSGIECCPATAGEQMKMTKRKFNKKSEENDRIAYHIIQGFALEDNITPQQAHDIGKRLVKELYPEYEAVVATHVDRLHLHNHIIINSVNYKTGKKLVDKLSDKDEGLYALRDKSNEIAKEYGCKILPDEVITRFKKNHYLYEPSLIKEQIKKDFNDCIMKSDSLPDAINEMKSMGYEVRSKKGISIKHPEANKFIKLDKIGDGEYTINNLKKYYESGKPVYNNKPLIQFVDENIFVKMMERTESNFDLTETIPSAYSEQIPYEQHDENITIAIQKLSNREIEQNEFDDFFNSYDDYMNSLMEEPPIDMEIENEPFGLDEILEKQYTYEYPYEETYNQYKDQSNESYQYSDQNIDSVREITDENDIDSSNTINEQKTLLNLSNHIINNNDNVVNENKKDKKLKNFTINKMLIVNENEKQLFVRIPNTYGKKYMYLERNNYQVISESTGQYQIELNQKFNIYDKNGNYNESISGYELFRYWDDKTKIEEEKNVSDKSNYEINKDDKTKRKTVDYKKIREEVSNLLPRHKLQIQGHAVEIKTKLNDDQLLQSAINEKFNKIKIRVINGESIMNSMEKNMQMKKMTAESRMEIYQQKQLSQIIQTKNLNSFEDIGDERIKLMMDIDHFSEQTFKLKDMVKHYDEIERAIDIYTMYYKLDQKCKELKNNGVEIMDISYFDELTKFRAASQYLERNFKIRNINIDKVRYIHVKTKALIKQYNQNTAIIRSKTKELNILNDYVSIEDIERRENTIGFSFARKRIKLTYEQEKINDKNIFQEYPTDKVEIVIPYLNATGEFDTKDIINRSGEACHIYLDKDKTYTINDEAGNELYVNGLTLYKNIQKAKDKSKYKYKDQKGTKNIYASKFSDGKYNDKE